VLVWTSMWNPRW